MPKEKRKQLKLAPAPKAHQPHIPSLPADLYEGLPVGIALVNELGAILYCNECFQEILQITNRPLIFGSNLQRFVAGLGWSQLSEGLAAAKFGRVNGEIRLEAAGRLHYVGVTMSPVRIANNIVIRLVINEKTELVETSQALQESQLKLDSLSAKVLALRDEERRSIARDLHDVTGQELAFITLTISAILLHEEQSEPVRQQLNESLGLLKKIQGDVRTLSYLLHPPMLDEIGLVAALQWYVGGLAKRSGLLVHLQISEPLPRQQHDHEIALFRVVQESLTNVIRHARAKNVWIRASVSARGIKIFVADDGVGIDPKKLIAPSKGSGVGIAGMDQRLRQFGGHLTLARRRPRGTEVCATVPLVAAEEAELKHHAEQSNTFGDARGTDSAPPKRILVADDHEITRRGIRALLEEQSDMQICGEVANGADAIAACLHLKPDVLILDLSMPEGGGFAVINRLRREALGTKILLFTTHSFPEIERTIRAAGCVGYVIKHNAGNELVKALRTILAGGTHFSAQPAFGGDPCSVSGGA